MTKDPVLRKVIASKAQVDPFMARHPLMQGLNCDDLLLSLAFGLSDAKLSKRFLIDRLRAATIRHDLEKRYQVMERNPAEEDGISNRQLFSTFIPPLTHRRKRRKIAQTA
ncbi:MAG: hypothetical protein ABI651_11145 [Verrucomicrobiota bacterium]